MNIGTFTQTKDGYTGALRSLTFYAKAKFVPAEKRSENSPDFRVVIDDTLEIGAAWKKTAKENDRPYLSAVLDDPSFPTPIYCRLVEDKGNYDLIWSRSRE